MIPKSPVNFFFTLDVIFHQVTLNPNNMKRPIYYLKTMSTFICLTKKVVFGNIDFMKFLRECLITLLSFLRKAFVCNTMKISHNKIKLKESGRIIVPGVLTGDALKNCLINTNPIDNEYIEVGHGRPKKSQLLCDIR